MTAAPTTSPSPMMPNAAGIGSSVLLEHKTCGICKASKPISEFHISRRNPDGRYYACKPCKIAQNKQYPISEATRAKKNAKSKIYRAENREHLYGLQKAWRAKFPERQKAINKRHYWNNRESRLAWAKNDRKNNPVKWRQRNKDRYWKDRDRQLERYRDWIRRNPDKADEYHAREYLSKDSAVPKHMWPDALVKTLITNRKLKRICQNQKT